MSEEEIYKMLLVEKLDKFPLLNELFAIRDSRGKRNDHTIYVNGYISLDVINNAIEKVNLLNSLKEIEQLHQEENGKLRVELEQERKRNKELSDKLTEKICKGAEEDILEEYRQQISELKEKNKEAREYMYDLLNADTPNVGTDDINNLLSILEEK